MGQNQVPAQGWGSGFLLWLSRGQKRGGGSCLHCDRSNASGVYRDRGDQGTVTTLPTEELTLASAVLFRCSLMCLLLPPWA